MFKNTTFAVVLAFCLALIGVPEVSATEYVNGILVEYYGNVGWWLQGMPDLDSRAPDLTVIGSEIDHPASSEVWDGLSSNFANHFAARHRALLEVPSDGTYVFTLTADDGAILVLDGEEVIVDDVPHGMRGASCSVELTAGLHEIQVDYFEEAGDAGLVLEWQGPGVVSGPIPPSAYFLDVEDGFGFGLSAEVFDMRERSALISDIPDLRGLAPCETGVVESVYFPASAQAWATFPQDRTDYYAARFTGWIKVDADGGHVFSLSADDGARLWIDGALAVDNGGRHSSVEVTNAVSLTAGLHRIRIEYLEMNGNAGLELRWSGPGFGKTVVPPDHLLHDLADSDSDADGIPDSWEISYGLDPDDPSDALSDPDGDGATCLQEYAAGTNPIRCTLSESVSAAGLKLELYSFPGYTLSAVPAFGGLAPDSVTLATNVCFGANELSAALDSFFGRGAFAARFSGYIRIPVSGRYDFRLRSDDGSVLWIDGERLVDCDGLHGARDAVGSRWFESGDYPVVVGYFDNGGSNELTLYWTGPGIAESPVPSSAFRRIDETVNRPLVSLETPESGRVFGVGNVIRIAASAYAYEGVVTEVDFFAGTDLIGRGSLVGGRWTLTWTNDCRLGEFTLSAVAVDSLGRRGVSTPVDLTVLPPPSGYSYGIDAEFYEFDRELLTLPELDGLHPSRTFRVSDVNYGKSLLAWTGFPESPSDRFAVRFSGNVWVRESGRYVLTVTSDDGAELRLDGTTLFEAGPLHDMQSQSVTVELSKGIHPFELRCYENDEYAGAVFAWTRADSSSEAEPIPEIRFVRQTGVVDSDGDGMPDWWEEEEGFDPADPADAGLDADADGLTNLAEYRAGTNPRSADTDADGMPDAWEVANGTFAYIADDLEDMDGDGLVNIEECRAGTDPGRVDTDGDGCGDVLEVRNVRSDPLVADITWTALPVGERLAATNAVTTTGTWRTDADGSVFSLERAGSLTWTLDVPSGGVDAFAVRVAQHEVMSGQDEFDLSLFVDGLFVSRQVVKAPYGSLTEAYFFLPEIAPGPHEFRVVWHNWEVNTFLSVRDLGFVRFGGPDADGNGVADWRDHRGPNASGIDGLPLESLVSPVCIEGHDLWRDILEVAVEYPETNAFFATVKTVGDGFYADIPLPEEGRAIVSLADRGTVDSFPVVWGEFDIAAGEYETEALIIRDGDSLRLAGAPGRESALTVYRADGEGGWSPVTNWIQRSATAYRFDGAGAYLVEAASDGVWGPDAAYARVDVVRSRFTNRNPATMIDEETYLPCPELSPRNVVEHDSELVVGAVVTASGGVDLTLSTAADRDLGLVSRLDGDGAISDAVQVTPVWADNGTYYHVVRTYPDGSQLVEISLLLGAVAPGTTVDLVIFVSGVMFEDGTRSRTLTADDFDENGHCMVRFVKARGVTTSVCHRTYIRQNGRLIYTND